MVSRTNTPLTPNLKVGVIERVEYSSFENPTHGSGWFVQILSTNAFLTVVTFKSHQRQLVDGSDPLYSRLFYFLRRLRAQR